MSKLPHDGKTVAPNNLPITCVRADSTMLEHEHADHPDYKFPIVARFHKSVEQQMEEGAAWQDGEGNVIPMTREDVDSISEQTHALIYADRSIALTLYECCYAMWSLRDGKVLCGTHLWKREGEWILTPESLEKIRKLKDG